MKLPAGLVVQDAVTVEAAGLENRGTQHHSAGTSNFHDHHHTTPHLRP
jgi:hypothetical protein